MPTPVVVFYAVLWFEMVIWRSFIVLCAIASVYLAYRTERGEGPTRIAVYFALEAARLTIMWGIGDYHQTDFLLVVNLTRTPLIILRLFMLVDIMRRFETSDRWIVVVLSVAALWWAAFAFMPREGQMYLWPLRNAGYTGLAFAGTWLWVYSRGKYATHNLCTSIDMLTLYLWSFAIETHIPNPKDADTWRLINSSLYAIRSAILFRWGWKLQTSGRYLQTLRIKQRKRTCL